MKQSNGFPPRRHRSSESWAASDRAVARIKELYLTPEKPLDPVELAAFWDRMNCYCNDMADIGDREGGGGEPITDDDIHQIAARYGLERKT